MTLTIDIGNSKIKITSFKNDSIAQHFVVDMEEDINNEWISKNIREEIKGIIICSVRKNISDQLLSLQKKYDPFIIFTHNTPIPIRNTYETPEKLGIDRLASAIGAYSVFPDKNCLIIDAGTAITFDLLSEKGEYLGGSISPGINTRFRSLAQYTQKLPLLELNKLNKYPAKSTEDSIQNGVQLGLIYEAEGYISEIKKYFPGLYVLVTGGDYDFFETNLKKPIFAEPNLIAKGLYRILKHNA
jgi:type III pantothenate kinase